VSLILTIPTLAKFGFWESLHLFSSIKIFLMARVINTTRPLSIVYRDSEDDTRYQKAKLLLQEMVDAGNMASRGHNHLLEELERMHDHIASRGQSENADGLIFPDLDVDIDNWLEILNASPTDFFIPS
jgi:proline utilization trans-activator